MNNSALTKLKRLIREAVAQQINEAESDAYISKAKNHNWAWFQSSSQSEWDAGNKLDKELKKLYNGLSDDAKLVAARWYKSNYPINDGSNLANAIKNWDIDKDGIAGFNGTHYRT